MHFFFTKLNKQKLDDYAINSTQNSMNKIHTMLKIIDQPDIGVIAVNPLAWELLRIDYAYIKRNAYSSLTESSGIRYMSFQEKTDTINLYEYYGWIQSVQITNANTHNQIYSRMVREHLDMSAEEIQPVDFYRPKVFKNAVLSYQSGLAYKLSKYQDCLDVINQFIKNNQIDSKIKES